VAQFHWRLGRHSGIVLARPPDESLDVEPLIEEGLAEANRRGIRRQALTPYVLTYHHEKSHRRTIELNKRLIAENAGVAAEVAVAYSKLT
jgi:pseudouridine-5'-phosphate glycosidase